MKSLLRNETVALRALEPTDLDVLLRWENNPEVWIVSKTQAPYSRKMIWQYLETYTGDLYASRELRLMVVEASTREPVGTIDLFDFDPLNNRAEMGMLVAPEHRGKGYAGEALKLFLDYASSHLGLRQVYAIIDVHNDVCMTTFRNVGFALSGTLRQWIRQGKAYHDAVVMQYLLD